MIRRVLVADDHAIARRGIVELLKEAFPGVEVVEASDASEVVDKLPTSSWDLVLLDIMMPGPSVLEVLSSIRAQDDAVPVLMLTGATEVEYVVQTIRRGANGLIHKHQAADELVAAIQKVASGGTYLHPDTAAALATTLRDDGGMAHERLSRREMEIFRRIALGQTVKEIAAELCVSDKTVATYLARIREKSGLNSHVEIARYALRHGIVD